MEGLADPIQESDPLVTETNDSEQIHTTVASRNGIIEEKQAEATIVRRPKRKAAQEALSKAFLDDEYDSPPSGSKNSKSRQGAGPKISAKRVSKTTRAELEAAYVTTAVAVNILPDIYEDVMDILSKSNENTIFDKYAIQNLVVTASLDETKFGNPVTAREEILAYILDTVKEDKEADWRDPMLDMNIIKRYHDLMESEEEKKKRSYRNEERKGYTWTRQDLQRFKIAFKKYGYSPTANRKIAKAIGPHIHPNHVGYFKQRLRRMHEKKKVEEIVESEAWDRMIATAPEHSTDTALDATLTGPSIVAGEESTLISPTTPALAMKPREERQKTASSFLPKKKKKRKPPPPQTNEVRQKRREEKLAQLKLQNSMSAGSAAETDILTDPSELDGSKGAEQMGSADLGHLNSITDERNADEPTNIEIINGRTFRKRKPKLTTTLPKKKKGRKGNVSASIAVAPLQHAMEIEDLSPSSPRPPLLEFPILLDQSSLITPVEMTEFESAPQERLQEPLDQREPSPVHSSPTSPQRPTSPPTGSSKATVSLSPLETMPDAQSQSTQSLDSPAEATAVIVPSNYSKISEIMHASGFDAIAPSPIVNEPLLARQEVNLDFAPPKSKKRKLNSLTELIQSSYNDLEPTIPSQMPRRQDISPSPPPLVFLPPMEFPTQTLHLQQSMPPPIRQTPSQVAFDARPFQPDPTIPFPSLNFNPNIHLAQDIYPNDRLASGLIAPPMLPSIFPPPSSASLLPHAHTPSVSDSSLSYYQQHFLPARDAGAAGVAAATVFPPSQQATPAAPQQQQQHQFMFF